MLFLSTARPSGMPGWHSLVWLMLYRLVWLVVLTGQLGTLLD